MVQGCPDQPCSANGRHGLTIVPYATCKRRRASALSRSSSSFNAFMCPSSSSSVMQSGVRRRTPRWSRIALETAIETQENGGVSMVRDEA